MDPGSSAYETKIEDFYKGIAGTQRQGLVQADAEGIVTTHHHEGRIRFNS